MDKFSSKMVFSHRQEIFLILLNIIPLLGVLFLDWSVAKIVYVYWLEAFFIGILNVFRIAFSKTDGAMHAIKLFLVPFFIVHYNIFVLVQGLFVFLAVEGFEMYEELGDDIYNMTETNNPALNVWMADRTADLLTVDFYAMVGAMIFYHIGVFIYDFIYQRGYAKKEPFEWMFAPYGRIILQQFVAIFGALAIVYFDHPVGLLLLLILLKTVADVWVFRKQSKDN